MKSKLILYKIIGNDVYQYNTALLDNMIYVYIIDHFKPDDVNVKSINKNKLDAPLLFDYKSGLWGAYTINKDKINDLKKECLTLMKEWNESELQKISKHLSRLN